MIRRSGTPIWPIIIGALIALSTLPAFAQVMPEGMTAQTGQQVFSGTGFFVSNRGHIITNAHVINGCNAVQIRGAVAPSMANLLASDPEHDLALLQTQAYPASIATLRNTAGEIREGDEVMIMGYPLEHAISGTYDIAASAIVSASGPQGESGWLQFRSVSQQGNSGGPLLDTSGNVIGVVTGKAQLLRYNQLAAREELVREADIAITLETLKQFLQAHGVYYRQNDSHGFLSIQRIANQARDYIVNIHCRPQVTASN